MRAMITGGERLRGFVAGLLVGIGVAQVYPSIGPWAGVAVMVGVTFKLASNRWQRENEDRRHREARDEDESQDDAANAE